jgi:glycosyltransferase involved in cell wall biosynthesis
LSWRKLLLDVPFTLEAWWRVARGRFDAVHAVEEALHLAWPIALAAGIPLVADVDSWIPEQIGERWYGRHGPLPWMAPGVQRRALRSSTAAVAMCRGLASRVQEAAPGLPVFVIEDPPLLSPLGPLSAGDSEVAQQVGARQVVVYTGNFQDYQGVECLLDAASRLSGVHLLLVGGDDRAITRMRNRARGQGLADRCTFLGQRPPDQLGSLLALANVVVAPRLHGRYPGFKLPTYLASGKPLVATRIPAHLEVLDEGVAFLVEPRADALAKGIERALREREEAARRTAAARALAATRFGWTRFVGQVAEAYAQVARPG